MTNEQLAEFIQQGGADDLKPDLYERVRKLLYSMANKSYSRYKDSFSACGVELSDLYSECYIVFLKALEYYKPAEGFKFATYLGLNFKCAVNNLIGINNADGINKKPLDNCISFEESVSADDETLTVGDTIRDETAVESFENVLDRIEDEHTRQVLEKAISRLSEKEGKVIKLHFFENKMLKEIAKQWSVSSSCIGDIKRKALKKLSEMPDVKILRAEQHIEINLHYDSRNFSKSYFEGQQKVNSYLKSGSFLTVKERRNFYDEQINAYKKIIQDTKGDEGLAEFRRILNKKISELKSEKLLL